MAAYDSSPIKAANTLDLDALITHMNELAVKWETTTFSDTTITGTSYTSMGTHTVTGVEADELCVFVAKVTLSSNTGADVAAVDLFINSVAQGRTAYYREPTATGVTTSGTTGKASTVTLVGFKKDLSGSIPFEIKVKRESGSGTIGIANITSDVLRFKYR